jgi:hypothetical protein
MMKWLDVYTFRDEPVDGPRGAGVIDGPDHPSMDEVGASAKNMNRRGSGAICWKIVRI